MPGRELLDRFRPAASPGTVARVGVPADVVEDADLRRVLDSLRDTLAEAARIRAMAHDRAAAIQVAAEAECTALLAQGRLDASEARARAAAGVIDRGRREAQVLLDEAGRRAERVRSTGSSRLPDVVDKILALVLGEIAPDVAAPPLVGGGDQR